MERMSVAYTHKKVACICVEKDMMGHHMETCPFLLSAGRGQTKEKGEIERKEKKSERERCDRQRQHQATMTLYVAISLATAALLSLILLSGLIRNVNIPRNITNVFAIFIAGLEGILRNTLKGLIDVDGFLG